MRKILWTLAILCCLLQIHLREGVLAIYEGDSGRKPDLFYLPPSNVIKLVDFGYDEVLADFIWVQTILYFSNQFVGLQDYEYLDDLLDNVLALDPYFVKAYIWAGTAFMYNGQYISKESINKSTEFLMRGWKLYTESLVKWDIGEEFWRIPFMIGFNYAIELKEKEKGAPFIAEAAKFPESPEYIRYWAASLLQRVGKNSRAFSVLQEQLSIEHLRIQLNLTENDKVKQQLLNRIALHYELAGSKQPMLELAKLQKRVENLFESYLQTFPFLRPNFYKIFYIDDQKVEPSLITIYPNSLFHSVNSLP